MPHPTGYWKSAIIPKLEESAPRETWMTILGPNGVKEKLDARMGEHGEKPTKYAQPSGIPLKREEIRASRACRPLSSAGE